MGYKPNVNTAALCKLLHPRQHVADLFRLACPSAPVDVVVGIDDHAPYPEPRYCNLRSCHDRVDGRWLTALAREKQEVFVHPFIAVLKLVLIHPAAAVEEPFV